MSEKMCPKTDVHLDRNSGVYLFLYDGKENIWEKTLESLLQEVARSLRGQTWIKEQRAALAVIGVDERGDRYLLNNPEIWVIEELEKECGYDEMPALKRISNKRIKKVIVRNMVLRGPDAVILTADAEVEMPSLRRGYTTLYPTLMSLNTQELKALMDELIKLRMLNLACCPSVRWMRMKYNK